MLDRKNRRCPVCSGPLILEFGLVFGYWCDYCNEEFFKDE